MLACTATANQQSLLWFSTCSSLVFTPFSQTAQKLNYALYPHAKLIWINQITLWFRVKLKFVYNYIIFDFQNSHYILRIELFLTIITASLNTLGANRWQQLHSSIISKLRTKWWYLWYWILASHRVPLNKWLSLAAGPNCDWVITVNKLILLCFLSHFRGCDPTYYLLYSWMEINT